MDIDERIRLALGERHDICLAYLFGSCASGTVRPDSDVDVAILFDHLPTPVLLDRLTEDLGVATERRVDLVVLNAAPPLLAREVIARRRLVMCRDEDERVRFETRTTARYQDTAHLRRVQYAYLRERAEAHRAGRTASSHRPDTVQQKCAPRSRSSDRKSKEPSGVSSLLALM